MKQSRISLHRSFRLIQGIVALLLVFLIVQGSILWNACRSGADSIRRLESEGLASLRHLGLLQENLAIYRLHSYELMSVPEGERAAKAAQADAVHHKNLEILNKMKRLHPFGEGQEVLAALESALEDYTRTAQQIRKQVDADLAATMKSVEAELSRKVMQLNQAAEQVKSFCAQSADARAATAVSSFSAIRNYVIGFGSVSIAFAALTALLVTLNSSRLRKALTALVDSLNQGSERLIDSAATVASASQILAGGASQQAGSIEQTSVSLEELSSMTKHNSVNSQKTNELAKQAREAADRGAEDMQAMSAAMEAIKNSSGDIAKIIKTIDEIAFQTNILALNAAVEAARAGEAGMGFAVVADEVRSLAQRSAQAAKETAAQIESAISKTAQGFEISIKVGKVLNDILLKARHVDELAAEVASASREQSQGIAQINSAVAEMDKVTQNNAASAQESAAAAEELNSQAAALKQAVAELLEMVGAPEHRITSERVSVNEVHAITNGSKTVSKKPAALTRIVSKKSPRDSRREAIPMDEDFTNF